MASNLPAMAIASNLLAMASKLASNLLQPTTDGPNLALASNPLAGLRPKKAGLQPPLTYY